MRRPAGVLIVLALAARASAQEVEPPAPLSVSAYVLALEEILPLAESGRLEEAREKAQALRRAEVEFAGERVGTDSTVLDGIATARTVVDARSRAPRLRRLVAALRATRGAETASDTRPEVLARLAPRDDAAKGGVVAAPLRARQLSVPARIGEAVLGAYDWVASLVRTILDWLAKLRPRNAPSAQQGGPTTAAIAVVAVAAVVLAVLAYRTLRRGAAAEEIASDQVFSSAKDEDPLSREVGEWERHARDLAASGRWREAVRAWYHAVLVCLFQQGLLHYQKGRTNWEYASRLAPETAWRRTFLDLTRLFDREWYGRPTSDAEAVRECARGAREILGAVRGDEEPA
ncbi:MAG TPA: DUF4129 domain-containing protein [Vicinamibacteria bacterium]|nr:DUF4129 domain-containing protein [Vicinamibacteria bacterium]